MKMKIKEYFGASAFYLLVLTSKASAAAGDILGPSYYPPEPGPGGATGNTESGGGVTLENPLGKENIIDVINGVLNYLIYISVPILAFMILWGGFQILTARDDPEKVKNGRKTIQWASIGFAVILISKGVALILLKILKG